MRKLSLIVLGLFVFSQAIIPRHIFAVSSPDLLVTPAILDFTIDPGKTNSGKVTIVNSSTTDRQFQVKLRSFNTGDNDGKPQLDDTLVTPLHEWINYKDATFTLPAKQHFDFTFTINVPADAGPGSYRTALLFADITPQPDGGTSSIAAELGPLLFVRISGEAQESAAVVTFSSTQGINETLPAKFDAVIENSGNVDLTPLGTINIVPQFAIDTQKTNFDFNPTSSRVLAGNQRNFESNWAADGFHIGYYEAELVFAYGKDNTVVTAKTAFWVLPWKVLAVAAAIILLVIFALFRRRRHNKLVTSDI